MQLSEQQFRATFGESMKRLSIEAAPPCEFWSYFDSIPASDFESHDCSAGAVDYVWESADGRFQHVLINSENKNIFMAIVLNVSKGVVEGHRLLDLEQLYGVG